MVLVIPQNPSVNRKIIELSQMYVQKQHKQQLIFFSKLAAFYLKSSLFSQNTATQVVLLKPTTDKNVKALLSQRNH